MSNIKWDVFRRAWKILRRWKIHTHRHRHRHRRPFPVNLRHLRQLIKRLVHPISTPPPLPPHYAERQFSFNDTPVFHQKLHRRTPPAPAWFPCTNPKVEVDYEFESCVVDLDGDGEWDRRQLCGGGDGGACDYEGEREEEEDHGIDLKAEKFIKMFYEEMKMQSN